MSKKKDIFTFIILHYHAIDDTKDCVKSIIKNCKGYNYNIVIVDNGSLDNSGILLKEIYKKNENIYVLLNKENLGFAKGNNIGFIYAKRNLKSDFIIMCNNDTKILQEDFLFQIKNIYKLNKYAVLGPEIILLDNKVNEVRTNLPSKKDIKKLLIKLTIKLLLAYIGLEIKLNRRALNKKQNILNNYYLKENVILHGCFLIFSRKYIDLFDGLDDRTFLYCEEELLYIRLKKNNLKSLYSPLIKIFHKEDASTNAVMNTKRKKRIFIYKNLISSNRILLKEIKESENLWIKNNT